MTSSTCCSCVVLNYNDAKTTIEFIQRTRNFKCINHIIIVDNCSTDNSLELLNREADSKCEVIEMNTNGGYGYGNNAGVKIAVEKYSATYVLIANPDTFIEENVLVDMIATMRNNNSIAIISPVQKDINDRIIDDYAWNIPTIKEYILMNTIFEKKVSKDKILRKYDDLTVVDCVPGALLLVNANIFLEVGGYDEDIFLFCEETTIGFKIKNYGYLTVLLPDKTYRHMHSISINKSIKSNLRKKKLIQKSRIIFMKKYLNASKFQLLAARLIFGASNIKTIIKNIFVRSA